MRTYEEWIKIYDEVEKATRDNCARIMIGKLGETIWAYIKFAVIPKRDKLRKILDICDKYDLESSLHWDGGEYTLVENKELLGDNAFSTKWETQGEKE